ncbi:hypothetical protein WMO66_09855 [Faecousia sp. CLA-AA-H192]|uniref:Uncharacterized protein n=1 Tax=Faecousia intestinalis TaxID=3133167 RepID=A0ABV1G828_9FIRM
MNNKININPSSTKWLEKDDRVVADYFCDLGFRSLKQILDMRVFDLMNELNALLNVDKRENEIVGGEPDEGDKPPEKKPRDLER